MNPFASNHWQCLRDTFSHIARLPQVRSHNQKKNKYLILLFLLNRPRLRSTSMPFIPLLEEETWMSENKCTCQNSPLRSPSASGLCVYITKARRVVNYSMLYAFLCGYCHGYKPRIMIRPSIIWSFCVAYADGESIPSHLCPETHTRISATSSAWKGEG